MHDIIGMISVSADISLNSQFVVSVDMNISDNISNPI